MRKMLFIALFAPIALLAQRGGPVVYPMPTTPPKNLKFLTGMSAADVNQTMQTVARSLGVDCSYCHYKDGGSIDYIRDENLKKNTARQMIAMTRELNAKFPDGKEHV